MSKHAVKTVPGGAARKGTGGTIKQ